MEEAKIIAVSRRKACILMRGPSYSSITSVISIIDPQDSDPPGLWVGRPRDSVLQLQFHDVVYPRNTHNGVPPTKYDVQNLLEFLFRRVESPGILMCHGIAGVSRPTAAAFLGLCLHAGWGNEHIALRQLLHQNPQAEPNEWMIHHAQKLLPEFQFTKALDHHFFDRYSQFSDTVSQSTLVE